jgi:hypothetical protein
MRSYLITLFSEAKYCTELDISKKKIYGNNEREKYT